MSHDFKLLKVKVPMPIYENMQTYAKNYGYFKDEELICAALRHFLPAPEKQDDKKPIGFLVQGGAA